MHTRPVLYQLSNIPPGCQSIQSFKKEEKLVEVSEENLGDAAARSINSMALSDPERLKQNHLLPAISEESLWVLPPV